MEEELTFSKDEVFQKGTPSEKWQKYCGFLELSLEEFMHIQESLLLEELEMVADSPLGKKILGGNKPLSMEDFRRTCPLTTYEDYCPELAEKREDILAIKPLYWPCTSGKGGTSKWIPFTRRADDIEYRNTVGAFILSAASQKEDILAFPKSRVMLNMPPKPYFTGWLAANFAKRIEYRAIPPLEEAEKMTFVQRIGAGFNMALRTGVDFVASPASVLVKIGETLASPDNKTPFSIHMLYPSTLFRLTRAKMRCKRGKREILPCDLWSFKGIVSWGTDATIYKKKLEHLWSREPFELYASTETGYIAMQAWNKKGMSFLADSVFLEFIPEEEWLKNRENKNYQPSSVLLNEVKPTQVYEIVITSFHGMPFLRYRLGDLVQIIALEDDDTETKTPQMVFKARADEIIDIAAFTRLDEKTMWEAIDKTEIEYEDWTARKEYEGDDSTIHLYIELKSPFDNNHLAKALHARLKELNRGYEDLDNMLGIQPIRVTILSEGTFLRYLQERQCAGADLAQLKPTHINALDHVIDALLRLSANKQ